MVCFNRAWASGGLGCEKAHCCFQDIPVHLLVLLLTQPSKCAGAPLMTSLCFLQVHLWTQQWGGITLLQEFWWIYVFLHNCSLGCSVMCVGKATEIHRGLSNCSLIFWLDSSITEILWGFFPFPCACAKRGISPLPQRCRAPASLSKTAASLEKPLLGKHILLWSNEAIGLKLHFFNLKNVCG